MISIIICSQNPAYLNSLKKNIAETVGTSYELLAVDNRDSSKGISTVYNETAAKAKYKIMCFLHEDVRIHTNCWGQVLINILADVSVGLVGISGAVYKSKYPGTWSACESSLYRTHSLQHFKNGAQAIETNINPLSEKLADVSVIDGVLMATTKKVFSKYHFDDKLLKDFHGYDLDYALQVGQQYKVVVSYDILLEHFSEGNLNRAWLENSLILHNKWAAVLPQIKIPLGDRDKNFNDYISLCCALAIALKCKGYGHYVVKAYAILLTRFYAFNKLSYSKTVFKYLLGEISN